MPKWRDFAKSGHSERNATRDRERYKWKNCCERVDDGDDRDGGGCECSSCSRE